MKTAVIIPCFNEGISIARVVTEFKKELPQAQIYVFDNNSTDGTGQKAREAGAIVIKEWRQGKGYVVQSMFRSIKADIYVMIDGDGTYPSKDVHSLIEPISSGVADMVVGSRLHTKATSQFKKVNLFGNQVFRLVLNTIWDGHLSDILSGYRVFNKRFVETVALTGQGFEIETELTIKALEAGMRIVETPVNLIERQANSYSKIRPVSDGIRILSTILALLRDYKPLTLFGTLAIILFISGLIPGGIVMEEFFNTGKIHRIPSAILAVGCVISSVLMLAIGVILHSITRRFNELHYQLGRIQATCDKGTDPLV